jgi:hypothetical protein
MREKIWVSVPIDSEVGKLLDHWRKNLPIPCSRAEAMSYMIRQMAKQPETPAHAQKFGEIQQRLTDAAL